MYSCHLAALQISVRQREIQEADWQASLIEEALKEEDGLSFRNPKLYEIV